MISKVRLVGVYYILLIICLIFPVYQLSGQVSVSHIDLLEIKENNQTDFYHLKFEGGNERNSINQFLQDTTGQMWIATKNGLIRYNGKQKYLYKPEPGNPNSIGHHFVTVLTLDDNGKLWVGTQKGLSVYRPATDDFVFKPQQLSDEYITDIRQDKNGIFWIINHKKNRLYRYNPLTDSLKVALEFDTDRKSTEPHILFLTYDEVRDKLYMTDSYNGILVYDTGTGKTRRIRLLDKPSIHHYKSKLRNIISRIKIDRNNPEILWIGTNLGYLIRYNLSTNEQQNLIYNTRLSNYGFHCFNSDIYQDDKDNIWITTWFYGTFKILPDRKSFVHFLPSPSNKNGISNTITTAVYQDKAGYFWFGTEYQGVDILKKNKKFHVFPSYPSRPGYLPPSHFLSITKDNRNRIWVGAEGAVYTLNPETLECEKQNRLFPGASRFFSLYFDSKNHLWTGTENGVYRLNEKDEIVEHLTYDKDNYQSISCDYISDITEDKEGSFWLGTFCAGVVKFNSGKQKFYRFVPDKTDPKAFSHPYVNKIFIDSYDKVWLGTPDGLNVFQPKAGNFKIYKNDKNNPKSIGSSVINDIAEAGDSLWIATEQGGLNLFCPQDDSFVCYTVKEGLPENNIKSILPDDKGNLWLATTKNIVKFIPGKKEFITYTASDGLENRTYVKNMGWQELSFSQALAYKDKEGYLYFGGSGGLVFFHPDSLPVNTYQAPLLIESIKVNGKKMPLPNQSLVLAPGQNQLEVEFTLINLIQPEKNKYAWKLLPRDSLWHYGDYLSKAEYYNLPPGEYQLYYKAANNDGIWTEARQPLSIRIKPHFYQTGWFYTSLGMLFLLLILSFVTYKWYLQKQIEKKRKMMRYSWSKLDENEARRINEKLMEIMRDKNIYLEPDLSLNKLAEIAGVKPNYLSQVINQYHQQNFFEFINSYRIEEAKRLLKETRLKIEAVAYDSGFNSLSTFNAVFKKITGITPSKFRKKN